MQAPEPGQTTQNPWWTFPERIDGEDRGAQTRQKRLAEQQARLYQGKRDLQRQKPSRRWPAQPRLSDRPCSRRCRPGGQPEGQSGNQGPAASSTSARSSIGPPLWGSPQNE